MKEFHLYHFTSEIKDAAESQYDDGSAATLARAKADDIARRMTDGLFSIPTITQFKGAIIEHRSKKEGAK